MTTEQPSSGLTAVAGTAAISFVVGGSAGIVIGFLIGPWMREFGWSSSLASSMVTAFLLALLLTAPGVGMILDYLGPRWVMTMGVLTTSVGLALASRCFSPYAMMSAFALVGIGYCAAFTVPSTVVIASWMGSKKGLGMGIIWGSVSIGAALFSSLIGWRIQVHGWRATLQVLALLVALMFPVAALALRGRPYSSESGGAGAPRHTDRFNGERIPLDAPAFIFAMASSVLGAFGMGGISYHVVPILAHVGYSDRGAAWVFGTSWLLSAGGSLIIGLISDRLGMKVTLVGALLTCALGTLFLLGAGQALIGRVCVIMFCALWGMTANAIGQLVPIILAERFGGQSLGTLTGIQSCFVGIAQAMAPVATGLIYDHFADYRIAIDLSALSTFLASLLVLAIQAPKLISGAEAVRV